MLASYSVREAGPAAASKGRNTRPDPSARSDRVPTRSVSAISVAGRVGVARNNSLIAGSTASTRDPPTPDGASPANARRTKSARHPSFRQIALIASDLCSRRISAQSSTVITLHRVTQGVHFQPRLPVSFQPPPTGTRRDRSDLVVLTRTHRRFTESLQKADR